MDLPRLLLSVAATLLLTLSPSARADTPPEGTDLELGGSGAAPGQFADLRDMAFDGLGNLLTLEGSQETRDKKAKYPGNARIQRFDAAGKPLGQFPLGGSQGDYAAHLAGDARGQIYVSFPASDFVRKYSPTGEKLAEFHISGANGLAPYRVGGRDRIAVIGGFRQLLKGRWANPGGQQITLLDGAKTTTIPLDRDLAEVADLAVDGKGDFYVLAAINALYKFSAAGKLLKVVGSQSNTSATDGSELRSSVAVDERGNVYALAGTFLARFDPDFQNVVRREVRYRWFQTASWKIIALDRAGRLWGGSPDLVTHELFENFHFLPAIVRTDAAFFDPQQKGTLASSTLTLGLKLGIEPTPAQGIAYDLKPFSSELIVAAANRNVSKLSVAYHVYDAARRLVGEGQAEVPLRDGQEARATMTFTPPRFGWYCYDVTISARDRELFHMGRYVGVTPEFPGLPRLEAIAPGLTGTNDAPRQKFVGLPNMRLNATANPKSLEALEKALEACAKFGTVPFVAFADEKDVTEAAVRAAVTRFKGKVKVWEIINEPNLRMTPEKYVSDYLTPAARVIHEVDPAAKVMGPAGCGIILPWYEGFFKAGGGQLVDIISLHDYEGHETVDPVHWRWKYGELRKLMAAAGVGQKELWQTERVLAGMRGGDFMPVNQAVQMAQHRDLLETLGIPPDHNNHYYLNNMGYAAVPSYLWSASGPHAAALVMRTRYAQTLGRTFAGTLDFGPTGNQIYSALRYQGRDGQTIVLRNEGTADQKLALHVSGDDSLHVVDAWGNSSTVPVRDGHAELTCTALPLFLRLTPKQEVTPPHLDFGRNLAEMATITYSGHSERPLSLLNNGVIETIHAGNPTGGTDGKNIWSGDLPETGGQPVPQALTIDFGLPRTFDKILLHGVRPDNQFCGLVDYDLQAEEEPGEWKTLQEVRSTIPPTDTVSAPPNLVTQWSSNEHLFVHRLPEPVTARRVRLIVRRVTYGFSFDRVAAEAVRLTWGRSIPPKFMLREMEIFAPASPLELEITSPEPRKTARFASETVRVVLENRSAATLLGTLRFRAPAGWKVAPAEFPVELPPGPKTLQLSAQVTPPDVLAIGPAFLEGNLTTAEGKPLGGGWLRYEITSPLELTPWSPKAIGTPQQALAALVKNISAAPLSGTAALQLGATTVEKPFGPIEPGKQVEVIFPLAQPPLNGARLLARYSATANQLQVRVAQQLGLRQWNVIGTWEKNLDEAFGPEKDLARGIDVAKGYTDMMGNEQKWRVFNTEADGYLNLLALQPNQNITAYALIYVQCPAARQAIFSAGTDDGGKAWLNGREVFTDPTAHDSAPGQVQKPVELKEGRNEVLFKIVQGKFNMGLHFDLLDDRRRPMTDLLYSPSP